ncbi:DUF2232 domain-containing protein [Bartonella sp. LJL80]
MTQTNSQNLSVGLLAGLFAAVLGMAIVSLVTVLPVLSIILGCFISLPIFIAAFGWGTLSSVIALLTATLVLGIAQNFHVGFGFMLLFFLPAVYASWLLGLAQPDADGRSVKWYPLSSVIFLLTSFIAIICVLIGAYFHSQPSTPMIAQQVADLFANAMRQAQSANEADILAFRDMIVSNIVPLLSSGLATYSLIFLIGNLYFSLVGAQRMKRLARPREDWPTSFRLPLAAVVIFLVTFLATFVEFGSIIDLCAIVFYTTFMLALSISGLAYLHNLTRGVRGRTVILSLVYIAIFTFVFAFPISIMIFLMGVWAAIQHRRQTSGVKS